MRPMCLLLFTFNTKDQGRILVYETSKLGCIRTEAVEELYGKESTYK